MQVRLHDLGNGKFQLRWSIDIDGKRRSRKKVIQASSKRQAQLEKNKLQREIDAHEYVDTTPLTVTELLERWLDDSVRGTVANQTLRIYESKVRVHIIPRLGKLRLDQLTTLRIDRFLRDLLAEGHSRDGGGLGTDAVRQIHHILKLALKQAVRWRLISRNPCLETTPPKLVDKDYQILTETQLERLIELMEGTPYQLPVLIAARTGMRRQEVLGLKWDCVNLEEGTILVRRALEWTKAGGLRIKDTKTRYSRRTLTIPDDLVRALTREKARQAALRLQLGATFNPERLVCVNSNGTYWLPDNFSGMFAEMMRRQDEVPIVSFHELRHTHASHLIWAGVPMKVISERLGHASIKITMDRYGHLLEGVQDREAIQVLEARRVRLLQEKETRERGQQETGT